jgi:hypothetical protein
VANKSFRFAITPGKSPARFLFNKTSLPEKDGRHFEAFGVFFKFSEIEKKLGSENYSKVPLIDCLARKSGQNCQMVYSHTKYRYILEGIGIETFM